MKTLLASLIVLFSVLCCFACSRADNSTPVVVHVFRDPGAAEIDTAIREIGQSRLVTPDNRPIVIATLESRSYREGLASLGKDLHPELLILDSFDDAMTADRNSTVAIKSPTRQYFAVIPSWAQGEVRTAANEVLSRMKTSLQPRN